MFWADLAIDVRALGVDGLSRLQTVAGSYRWISIRLSSAHSGRFDRASFLHNAGTNSLHLPDQLQMSAHDAWWWLTGALPDGSVGVDQLDAVGAGDPDYCGVRKNVELILALRREL